VRFVVYGAGAIGGVLGARLHEHGHEVALVARGPHLAAMRSGGLQLETPDGTSVVRLPVSDHLGDLRLTGEDVVLLTTKSQHTAGALDQLAAHASSEVPVVCVQNGVENERVALRRFPRVYGVCVMLPATYLEPGVVQAHSTPTTGILDVGRYPDGEDQVAERIADAFAGATFASRPLAEVMRWKYTKLLMNLGNAVEAVCGPPARAGEIAAMARREGEAVLRAASIAFASDDEDRERRGDLLRLRPIAGRRREGGSSWQSLRRGAGSIETDHLNGEIVLLGRLHGVETPVNELLQRLANRMAHAAEPPGSVEPEAFLAQLGS
jgi:2-dehydropantoate 2-reductase